jgi:hypothetical protein
MVKDPPLPQIPCEIQKEILPDKDLSVLDILKFHLPAAARSINGSFNHSQKFLSTLTPMVTNIEEIRTIPTPPLDVLNELVKLPELLSSQSVLCLHAPGFVTERLPMWTLSYWVQVFHLRPLKKKWLDAEESLQKQGHSKQRTDDTQALVSQVQNTLACISWAADIKGFSASISTVHLATYLTQEWFTDEHENQMLYLLRQKVSRERREDGIDVCDTFFMEKLINLQQDEDGPNRYATGANYAWLREKGQELATGVMDMLVTIANIESNHWVAVVIDFKSSYILYGDSMGGTIDDDVQKALTWWIHHHTGKHFTKGYLPITRQRDGHSCGILAWTALAQYLFPGTYSRVDAGLLANERLRMFLWVSDRHNEKVSKDHNLQTCVTNEKKSFNAMAEGYEFTVQAPDMESSEGEVEIYETPQVLDSGLARTMEESASENEDEMTSNFTPSSPSLSHAITPLSRPVTPPTQIASGSKRTLTPEGSPQGHEKKKSKLKTINPAIRNAFELSKETKDLGQEPKFGLLKFFSKGTAEDKRAYFAREDERAENTRSLNNVEVQNIQMEKKLHERELARRRQQKRRQLLKETEIKAKVRSPGGTKRKVSSVEILVDKSLLNQGCSSLRWSSRIIQTPASRRSKEILQS